MTLSPEQEERLKTLVQIFLEENKNINLSAYRTEEQCWVGNVLDSVAVADIFSSFVGALHTSTPLSTGSTPLHVIDVGTGGGFPLLPLAILFSNAQFTGLDATKKKIDAVQRIVDALKLRNVELVIGRAEELGHDSKLREQFDVVLARGIAPLAELLEYMSPFLKKGGKVICWKSVHIEDELTESVEARMKLNVRLTEKQEYELPGDWGRRQLLIFEKIGELSKEFPRGVGEAKKNSL